MFISFWICLCIEKLTVFFFIQWSLVTWEVLLAIIDFDMFESKWIIDVRCSYAIFANVETLQIDIMILLFSLPFYEWKFSYEWYCLETKATFGLVYSIKNGNNNLTFLDRKSYTIEINEAIREWNEWKVFKRFTLFFILFYSLFNTISNFY